MFGHTHFASNYDRLLSLETFSRDILQHLRPSPSNLMHDIKEVIHNSSCI